MDDRLIIVIVDLQNIKAVNILKRCLDLFIDFLISSLLR